jgi:hypothetical protein
MGVLASLVARLAGDADWSAGLTVVADLREWCQAVTSGGWIDRTLASAGVAGDVVDLVCDQPGTLAAWAASLLQEQVAPLRHLLNVLGGNLPEAEAAGQAWVNIANHTGDTGDRLGCSADAAAWNGSAAEGYRSETATGRDVLLSLGLAAGGLGSAVQMLGALASAVRDGVRELISQCVSTLVVRIPFWAAAGGAVTAITGGVVSIVVLPALVAKVAAWVARYGRAIKRLVNGLVRSASRLYPLLHRHLANHLDTLQALLHRRHAPTGLVRPELVPSGNLSGLRRQPLDGTIPATKAQLKALRDALPRTPSGELIRHFDPRMGNCLGCFNPGGPTTPGRNMNCSYTNFSFLKTWYFPDRAEVAPALPDLKKPHGEPSAYAVRADLNWNFLHQSNSAKAWT